MHAETLAYMLHQLLMDRKRAEQQPPTPPNAPAEDETVEIPGGCATLGMARNGAFEVTGWGRLFSYTNPPLSDIKNTTVRSERPRLSSFFRMRPTFSSRLEIIAA